jgi:glycosyltransferase involved in cell wall biosynthesis
MKIALITSGSGMFNFSEPSLGVFLVKYLARKGHKITVVDAGYHSRAPVLKRDGNITAVYVPTLMLPSAPLLSRRSFFYFIGLLFNRLSYAISIAKYLMQEKFDVIHCQSAAAILPLLLFCRSLGNRMILHSMVAARVGLRTSWLDYVVLITENFVAKRVRKVVLETELARKRLIAEAKLKPEKTCVIETGVDTWYWQPDPLLRRKIRKQYGLDDKVVVLFLGRIIERKGVIFLLKAADIIVNKKGYRNVVFLIAGPTASGSEDPDSITPYLKQLILFINSNNLAQVVKIIPGWRPKEMVKGLYDAADIYVLPTLADLTPHSISQALAMGKPVIASAVGGIPELVQDGETGFLVPPMSEQALADRLEKLINDPMLRGKMGEKGRQVMLRRSCESNAKKFEELYLSILASTEQRNKKF